MLNIILLLCTLLIYVSHAQRCVRLADCPQVLSDFKFKKIIPTYCDEDDDLVDCSPPPQNIEERKCLEYSRAVFHYDETEDELKDKCTTSAIPFVVGGTETSLNEFPHQALLGDGQNWFCGGSLVSEKYVVTAAHCLISDGKPPSVVRLGMHDVTRREPNAQNFNILRTIAHPNYKPSEVYHDIAIIELLTEVKSTHYIHPICLPTKNSSLSTLIATGYGLIMHGGLPSKTLQKVELPQKNKKICIGQYLTDAKLPKGVIQEQLCFGGVKGKDTCQGDSGGPLQGRHDKIYCSYILYGVTSTGHKCGYNFAGLYTNVFEYMPWIKSIIW